jgi:LmbE family N-acetylglucosaminyl deacetylase
VRVLAIAAHPDDIESCCAGTLARYAAAGHQVIMAHLCNGALGGRVPKQEMAAIRKREAEASASVIGAETLGPLFEDLDAFPDRPSREAVAKLIRRARPDLIIAPPPDDYHPDHVSASQLVFDASFLATLPNFESEEDVFPRVVPLFYMESASAIGFVPTEYVDISPVIDQKRRMLLCHQSQVRWMKEYRQVDLLADMETISRFRGLQCGVAFAEGFRRLLVARRTTPERLLP